MSCPVCTAPVQGITQESRDLGMPSFSRPDIRIMLPPYHVLEPCGCHVTPEEAHALMTAFERQVRPQPWRNPIFGQEHYGRFEE